MSTTHHSTVTIRCDHNRGMCDEIFVKPVGTVMAARTLAAKEGWSFVGERDFCKEHTAERSRVETAAQAGFRVTGQGGEA